MQTAAPLGSEEHGRGGVDVGGGGGIRRIERIGRGRMEGVVLGGGDPLSRRLGGLHQSKQREREGEEGGKRKLKDEGRESSKDSFSLYSSSIVFSRGRELDRGRKRLRVCAAGRKQGFEAGEAMRSFGCVCMGGGLRVGGSDGRKCRNLLKKNIIHRRKKHVPCLVRRSRRGAFLGGWVGRARIGRSMDHYLKFRYGGWSEGKVSSAAAKGRRTLSSNAIGRAGGPFSRGDKRGRLCRISKAQGAIFAPT